MKILVRALAALVVVALATPAFACGESKQTSASAQPKADAKQPVAKADKKDAKAAKQQPPPAKPQSAQN